MSGVRAGYECEASRLMAIPGGGNSVDVSTFEIQARLVEHKLSKADFVYVHLVLIPGNATAGCVRKIIPVGGSRPKCASSAAVVFPCQTASVSFTRLPLFHHPQLQIAYSPAHFRNVTDFYCCKGVASVAYHHPTRMSGQFSSPQTFKHMRNKEGSLAGETDG
jgi:hypothetical protein